MNQNCLSKSVFILSIPFMMLLLNSCECHKKNSAGKVPQRKYTQGIILEPLPPGSLVKESSLDAKYESRKWAAGLIVNHTETYTLKKGETIIVPIELTTSSIISIIVNSYGKKLKPISAQLFHEGDEKLVWIGETITLYETQNVINSHFEITADLLKNNSKFLFKLTNQDNKSVVSQVVISTISLSTTN